MAPKRRPRYEDTGARKCRKMFHAKLEHEYAKLRIISRAQNREEFSSDKRGDVMPVEARQNQETFYEGAAAAGELNGGINEQISDTFGEHSHSSSVREEDEELCFHSPRNQWNSGYDGGWRWHPDACPTTSPTGNASSSMWAEWHTIAMGNVRPSLWATSGHRSNS